MRIIPARLTHVGPLALNMRQADQRESRALGRTPKEALRMGIRMSLYSLSAIDDEGKPMAMFGVVAVSMLSGVGRPWFLGTDRVFMHPRELLCTGKRIIAWWQSEFPHLENIVSADNVMAIRLLKRWGFEVGTEEEVHQGVAFVPFHLAIQAAPVNA